GGSGGTGGREPLGCPFDENAPPPPPTCPTKDPDQQGASAGCVFYPVDTNPSAGGELAAGAGDFAIVVTNVDTVASAEVVIDENTSEGWMPVPDGTFTLGPRSVETRTFDHRQWAGSGIHPGAYRIRSDRPIQAYQFNPLHGQGTKLSDASLLLPAWAFDTHYIAAAWPRTPADYDGADDWPANLQIVAHEPTRVTVRTPVATSSSDAFPEVAPDEPTTFCLEEGEYLQLTAPERMDSLNGSFITADKPLGVFSSNDCANVPALTAEACCCDHLEEQLFGLSRWGTRYVAARVPMREGMDGMAPPGIDGSPAIWQIMAQDDGTTVQLDATSAVTGVPGGSVVLQAREMVQVEVSGTADEPGDFFLEADKPIFVTQYMVGARYDPFEGGGDLGDPSMIVTVPVEQYLRDYVVLVPSTWLFDFLVIVRQQGAEVSLDGAPVDTTWAPAGASGYEVTRVAVDDGVHAIASPVPLGVTVVGYDWADSYGYPGGLAQRPINPIY
ncbi:MAG: IgGFc-binding protein, partial [Myxococcales bacterium]|nr:IgGFc-binding protein [Myxococcales bacterium]